MKNFKDLGFATRANHIARHEEEYGTLTFPIYASSTMIFEDTKQGGRRFAGQEDGYIYSRLGNPSTTYLQEKIAGLENCEAALALSSGMGAIATALWTELKAGDHIVADEVLYGCTRALLEHQLAKFGVETSFIDFTKEGALEAAIQDNTKVLYFETPANPTLKIIDIEYVAKIGKKHGITTMCDNTVATPYLTRPKDFGIDVILHSATKYLNGHGDVIAGIICGDKDFITRCNMEGLKDMTGAVMSAFDAFLINRGLKTLTIRMDRHSESAMKVAQFLEAHPAVDKVYYPGLKSHKDHDVAAKQMTQFSGLMAFELKGGYEAAEALANNLQVFSLAVSLGDTESLIQHPASMTHSPYSPEARLECGIKDSLLRASIGLEDVEDLINDLKTELDKLI